MLSDSAIANGRVIDDKTLQLDGMGAGKCGEDKWCAGGERHDTPRDDGVVTAACGEMCYRKHSTESREQTRLAALSLMFTPHNFVSKMGNLKLFSLSC